MPYSAYSARGMATYLAVLRAYPMDMCERRLSVLLPDCKREQHMPQALLCFSINFGTGFFFVGPRRVTAPQGGHGLGLFL
ncbi:unnamed protein product [Chondrus crispus]|uniref:Uncharacterized protein n=1 Tax=Chondrus crispus TaxID=2769 RepID=R7QHQ6_CHOCR|nr:unnamed protein product [Chondrus crispus]CDF37308.1 unnamed protein product [Chondrus crispus]|eukprot:XP_005717127.1 unnamed protein product [Chondrus crispus]